MTGQILENIQCPACKKKAIKPFRVDPSIEEVSCQNCGAKVPVVWQMVEDDETTVH